MEVPWFRFSLRLRPVKDKHFFKTKHREVDSSQLTLGSCLVDVPVKSFSSFACVDEAIDAE